MSQLILVVDDKPEIAKIIMLYLAKYDVKYEDNPVKAIEWLKQGNVPDLIVSDLNMPEMTGEQFLHYLRSDENYKNIPVIILSSIEDRVNRLKLIENGADDFLLKPFNPEEIRSRVRQILN